MFKKVFLTLIAVIALFSVVVAMQPSEFKISRTTSINAPVDTVFTQVNNLHNWEAWSPWAKLDPAAKTSYAGPAEGTGAIFKWDGNNQVGEGSMIIMESHQNELVKFKLEFLKPFAGTNIAEFIFKPEGDKTNISWSMSGHNNFISKAVGLVFNCEKIVGGQFEKGLADMKSIAESKK